MTKPSIHRLCTRAIALAALTFSTLVMAADARADEGYVVESNLNRTIAWANVQMRVTGANRYVRDFEKHALLEVYQRDAKFPRELAIKYVIELRAQMEASRRSPDGRRVDAINDYLDVTESAEKALPFFKGAPQVIVDSFREATRLYLKSQSGEVAKADAYTSTVGDSNLRNAKPDPQQTFYDLRARAHATRPDLGEPSQLELAYNGLYAADENNRLLNDADQTRANNPVLAQFAVVTGMIDQRTGQLRTEIRNGVRTVRFDIEKMRAEFGARMGDIEGAVEGVQQTLQTVQAQQVALNSSFTAFVASEEARRKAQEEAERAAAEHQQLLVGLQSSVQLIATVVGGEEGRYISTIGNAAIQIGESINQWTKVVACIGDLANPLNMLNTVTMVASVVNAVQTVVALFGDPPPPSIEEMIFEQIRALQNQVADLGQHLDRRFDRLDSAINTVFDVMVTQFGEIRQDIADLDVKVSAALLILRRSDARLRRLEDAVAQFAEAEATEPVQDWITYAIDYDRKHPGASGLPYDEFVKAMSKFSGFGTVQARTDTRLVGTAQRPLTWEDAATELAKPLESNLAYLDSWSQILLATSGKPAQSLFGPNPLNPRAWAWAGQAFSALALDRPDYAAKDFNPSSGKSQFFDDMIRAGSGLQTAFDRLTANTPLFDTLFTRYGAESEKLLDEAGAIRSKVVSDLAMPRNNGATGDDLLWDEWMFAPRSLPDADLLALPGGIPFCGGGTFPLPAPSNFAVAGRIPQAPDDTSPPSDHRRRLDYVGSLAQRFGIREARTCWTAAWTDLRPTGFHKPTFGRIATELRSEVREPGGEWKLLNQLTYTTQGEYHAAWWEVEGTEYHPRWIHVAGDAADTLMNDWASIKPAFERDAHLVEEPALYETAKAVVDRQHELRDQYAWRLHRATSDETETSGAELRRLLDLTSGLEAMIRSFTELGFAEALGVDEYFQMLVNGPTKVVHPDVPGTVLEDGSLVGGADDLLTWIAGGPHPERDFAELDRMLPARVAALKKLVDRYRAKAVAGEYDERNPLVADTLVLLRATETVVRGGVSTLGDDGRNDEDRKDDGGKDDGGKDDGVIVDPAGDTRPPVVTSSVQGRVRRSTLATRGARLRQRCDEACTVRTELLADRATARRLKLGARPLGTARVTLPGAGDAVVRVRAGRAAARRLARGRVTALTLRVTATDAAGNAATLTQRLRLR